MRSYYIFVPLLLILLFALIAMKIEYTNFVQWTPADERPPSFPSSSDQSFSGQRILNISTEDETEVHIKVNKKFVYVEINPKIIKTKSINKPTIKPTNKSTTKQATKPTIKSAISPTSISLTHTTISTTSTTPYSYDARLEIDKRRDHLKSWCEQRNVKPGFRSMPFRTGYVSKWGKSLGGVNFWVCFTPKCASTSFSIAALAATGICIP